MCGRFIRSSAISVIEREFGLAQSLLYFRPSYNIAPTQLIVIIVTKGKRRLAACKRGFIPPWAKDASSGYKMINARAETVAEKPTFKNGFKKHGALLLRTGFLNGKGKED